MWEVKELKSFSELSIFSMGVQYIHGLPLQSYLYFDYKFDWIRIHKHSMIHQNRPRHLQHYTRENKAFFNTMD
jgi:hypothetical protein